MGLEKCQTSGFHSYHMGLLSGLTFLLYINDMHLAMQHSTICHFADDTNLIYSCKSLKPLRKKVNKDLQLIYDWLCSNCLQNLLFSDR